MSISNNSNIGVPPVNPDKETSSITGRPRQNIAVRRDFRKVLDKDEKDQNEDDSPEVALPIDKKEASVDKPKRPNLLSLASQASRDAGTIAVTVGSGKQPAVNTDDDDITDEEEAALAAALLAFAKEVAKGASDAGSILASNNPQTVKKNPDLDARTLQGLLGQHGSDSTAKDSPFSVYKNMKNKDSNRSTSDGEGETVLTRKDTARFGQEEPDLSYVNLMAGPASIQSAAAAEVRPTSRAPYIQKIVNQMIEEIKIMRSAGQTETVITIRNNPIFNGAQLTITGYDSAVRQFNIAFHNLSPAAKQLIDVNQADLKMALAEKNLTVHIVVATTETEKHSADERDGRGYGQNSQEQEDNQQG